MRIRIDANAQARLYEVCETEKAPLYELTLAGIKSIAESISLPEGRVLLYHGSKSGITGPIALRSRERCDFGRGFYMGTELSQALTLICDYEKSKLYIVSVDMTDLKTAVIQANIEWAMLVAYHRGRMERIAGTPLYEKYSAMLRDCDMAVGCIADDRMFYVIDNFFIGNITDAALVGSLKALQLGRQYVALTERACGKVRIEAEIELSYIERACIKDIAEKNRQHGISLADSICREYRREGLYFDELLDRAAGGDADEWN